MFIRQGKQIMLKNNCQILTQQFMYFNWKEKGLGICSIPILTYVNPLFQLCVTICKVARIM